MDKYARIIRPDKIENGLIVLLPSAGRKHLPQFTRFRWANLFPKHCIIAIADPSLNENNPNLHGGWFLNSKNGSFLPEVFSFVEEMLSDVPVAKRRVCFAGSSMGGYAAIWLSMLSKVRYFCYADCPQLYLTKHRGSRKSLLYHFKNKVKYEHYENIDAAIQYFGFLPKGVISVSMSDKLHVIHLMKFEKALMDIKLDFSNEDIKIIRDNFINGRQGHESVDKSTFKSEVLYCLSKQGKERIPKIHSIKISEYAQD
ncbi:hypothetical protein [Microbulbifer sp. PSTR4-B]|uniref:hypothetical protein n=1 Tax=Microbulbifer sp. PSTR4-B TaxID=3243396 RepID=UPI00403914B7